MALAPAELLPGRTNSRGKGGPILTAKAVDIHQNFSQVMKLVDDIFLL